MIASAEVRSKRFGVGALSLNAPGRSGEQSTLNIHQI
jgi:hypothetical protein